MEYNSKVETEIKGEYTFGELRGGSILSKTGKSVYASLHILWPDMIRTVSLHQMWNAIRFNLGRRQFLIGFSSVQIKIHIRGPLSRYR